MTSPDPVPLPPMPVAAIVTTDGTTSFATCVTAHALTAAEECAAELDDDELVVQPATAKTAPPATHGSHRRVPCECFDPVKIGSLLGQPPPRRCLARQYRPRCGPPRVVPRSSGSSQLNVG